MPLLSGKILGYIKEIGISIGKGSQGHKGVNMFWEGQQLQLEWISKEKLVQLWIGNQPLEVWLRFFLQPQVSSLLWLIHCKTPQQTQ